MQERVTTCCVTAKAALITRIRRGHIAFSERGQSVLAQNPAQISISLLLVGSDPEFMQKTRHDLLRDLVS